MTAEQSSSSPSLLRYRHIREPSSSTSGLQRHIYLDVELEHSKSFQPIEEADGLRLLIHASIAQLFGEAGYSIQFEVLKFRSDGNSTRAYLRVPGRDYVRLRIALQLVTSADLYEEDQHSAGMADGAPKCWFKIHKAAHSLASLAFRWDISDHVDDGKDDIGSGGLT